MVKLKRLSIRLLKIFQRQSCDSIIKKRRLKEEELENEYPEVRSDFSLKVVDKPLFNIFEGLLVIKYI